MKIKLISTLIMSLFILSCSQDLEEKPVVNEADDKIGMSVKSSTPQNNTEENLSTDEVKQKLKSQYQEYFDYSIFNLQEAETNKELYSVIKNDIESYESIIFEILITFGEQIEKTKSERNQNIKELQEALDKQTANFEKNCKPVKENLVSYCNELSVNNSEIAMIVQRIEDDKKSTINKLISDRETELNRYREQMKKNISNLLEQGNIDPYIN